MKTKLLLLLGSLAVVCLVGLMVTRNLVRETKVTFDKDFYHKLNETPIDLENKKLFMAIVPHHLLAKPWISELWATVGVQKPETIILLSPNHFESNTNKITTSSKAAPLFNDLSIVQSNDQVIEKDHGITTHVPFMGYFSPESKVVPLVVNNTTTKLELDKLVDHLKRTLNPQKTVIVASIDFSHYLNRQVADQKDTVTEKLIQKRNFDEIFKLTNDHVDARAGLVLWLKLSSVYSCPPPTIFHHGNSADFAPKTNTSSTSYFVAGIMYDQCQGLTNP